MGKIILWTCVQLYTCLFSCQDHKTTAFLCPVQTLLWCSSAKGTSSLLLFIIKLIKSSDTIMLDFAVLGSKQKGAKWKKKYHLKKPIYDPFCHIKSSWTQVKRLLIIYSYMNCMMDSGYILFVNVFCYFLTVLNDVLQLLPDVEEKVPSVFGLIDEGPWRSLRVCQCTKGPVGTVSKSARVLTISAGLGK